MRMLLFIDNEDPVLINKIIKWKIQAEITLYKREVLSLGKISRFCIYRLLENAFAAIEHLKMLSDTDPLPNPKLKVHIILCKHFYTIVC